MKHHQVLSEGEIKEFLAKYPVWRYEAGELKIDLALPSFADAIAEVNQIAQKAEELNHHPTWTNTYNKLSISMCTHDAGNKITDLDIKMATFISEMIEKYK